MSFQKFLFSVLGLRVVTLLLLAASAVVLVTDNVKISNGSAYKYTDFHAYRYLVFVMGVGIIYTLIQLPFDIIFAASGKRWIKGGWLPLMDFYGDKVVSLILASGVGVGFGYTVDTLTSVKKAYDLYKQSGSFDSQILDEAKSKYYDFLDRALFSTAILFAGLVTTVIISIITFIKRSEQGRN